MTQDRVPERTEATEADALSSDPDLSVKKQETVDEAILPETDEEETEAGAEQPEAVERETDIAEEEEAESEEEIIERLNEELAMTKAQADEYLDKLQRTAAEFQNSRRRQERQLLEETERANGDLIRRLLPVLDDLDLAFENMPANFDVESEGDEEGDGTSEAESLNAWLDGFRQIQRKLLDVLADEGVNLIEIEGLFDPMRHEAISSEPDDGVESGHIIGCLRAGYEYKGRVLRPALVRVAM